MQFKLLQQMSAALATALDEHQRFYALDDNHIIALNMPMYVSEDVSDRPAPRLVVLQRHVQQRGDERDVEWESVELETLPDRHLIRFAEIRGTVEKWISGEVDDLPASTVTGPLAEHRVARHRRYRR